MALKLKGEVSRDGRPLEDYDYGFLFDRSGSMDTRERSYNNMSRWDYGVKELIQPFVNAVQEIDSDGIDLAVFDNEIEIFENTTSDRIASVFKSVRPRGGTSTASAIERMVNTYRQRQSGKPYILICATDGEPTDARRHSRLSPEDDVRDVIIQATKSLKQGEFYITFIQVGSASGATAFLEDLDDNLTGAAYDMVSSMSVKNLTSLLPEQILRMALTGKIS